jgi:hypothetical protein
MAETMNDKSDNKLNEHNDKRFNDALASWGQENSATQQSIELAKNKTLAAWQRELTESTVHVASNPTSHLGRKLIGLISIAAAMLLGCFLVVQFFSNPTNQSSVSNLDTNAFQNAASPEEQRELLNRFQELFGDQLSFVSDINDDMQVTLDDSTNAFTKNDFVAIQVTLLSRVIGSGDVDWKLEQHINLLSRHEQRIDIGNNLSKVNYSMWTLPVEQDLLSIDLRFRFAGQTPVEFSKSELQVSGATKQIHSFTQANIEYRVYQTGIRLDESETENAVKRLANNQTELALHASPLRRAFP